MIRYIRHDTSLAHLMRSAQTICTVSVWTCHKLWQKLHLSTDDSMQLSDRLQYIRQEVILPESFVSWRFPTLHNVRPFYYNQDLFNHPNCSVIYSTSLIFASSPIQNEGRTVKPEILPPSMVLIIHLWKYRIVILSTSYYTQCTVWQHCVGVLREGIIWFIMATNLWIELIIVTNYVGSTW